MDSSVLQSLKSLWGKASRVYLSEAALVEVREELISLMPQWSPVKPPIGDPDYQGTIFGIRVMRDGAR